MNHFYILLMMLHVVGCRESASGDTDAEKGLLAHDEKPVDAGAESKDASGDASDAARCRWPLKRATCADSSCNNVGEVRIFCSDSSGCSTATSCYVEKETGDLWYGVCLIALEGVEEDFRDCTEEEKTRLGEAI